MDWTAVNSVAGGTTSGDVGPDSVVSVEQAANPATITAVATLWNRRNTRLVPVKKVLPIGKKSPVINGT